MKALASCDVDVIDGIWRTCVADMRHGVELAPLHMRTVRGGFGLRPYACMDAIIGSRSILFGFCGRHLADSALLLLQRRRLHPRL